MNKKVTILSLITTSVFLVAACGSPAATVAPTVVPVVQATAIPTTAPTVAATSVPSTAEAAPAIPDVVKVLVSDSKLGKILVGPQSMALYMYAKDSANTSVCYDKCATAWPPLLTKSQPQAGDGADSSLIGTTTRKDGSLQVTYKGMPLYYFAGDKAVGDVAGQNLGNVWYVVAPNGDVIGRKSASEAPSSPSSQTGTLAVSKTSLGQILVGSNGMTLYMFAKDSNGTSACYDQCAQNWPPLIVTGKPTAGAGVDGSLIGTVTRKDGNLQATYKGMPLYYFFKDKAVGDVNSQNVGNVWYVVAPNGDVVKGSASTSTNSYGN